MAYMNVADAIKEAEKLLEQKRSAIEKVAVVRTDLRNAITMGTATTDQRKWIEGTFPLRERKTKGDKASVVPIPAQ